jgi:hypothetical protein
MNKLPRRLVGVTKNDVEMDDEHLAVLRKEDLLMKSKEGDICKMQSSD